MAVAFRSSSTVVIDTNATFSVTKPTGCVDGDLLLAWEITSLAGGGTAPATPSGWTLKESVSFGVGTGDFRCFEKVASSEPASWTFNGAGGTPASPKASVYVVCLSGANPSEGGSTATSSSAGADSITPGAYTTLVDNELVVTGFGTFGGFSASITPDGTYTDLGQTGGSFEPVETVGYKAQASAGAIADRGATYGSAMDGAAILRAVPPFSATPPVAAFSGTPLTGAAALSVTFTDASTNTPTSWLWEKNSGSGWVNFAGTPTNQNPVESFAAGTWDVRLTATNAAGSDAEEKPDYVVSTTPPVAAFSGTPLSGSAPLSVVFTDASTNTPTSWLWQKNPGTGYVNFAGSPTAQNPTESFAAGVWDVKLTATNAGGSDPEEKLDYVTSNIVAAFSGTPLMGPVPLVVTFTDASTGSPTSWLWEKNDGSGWVNFAGSPTVQNPVETFTGGTWDVRLTASTAIANDAETKLDYVSAGAAASLHRVINSRLGTGGGILRRRVGRRL